MQKKFSLHIHTRAAAEQLPALCYAFFRGHITSIPTFWAFFENIHNKAQLNVLEKNTLFHGENDLGA